MQQSQLPAAEVVRRGEEIYSRDICNIVEPEHRGKFLVLDIDTGEYEIDADEVAALLRAVEKNPDGTRYIKRIGFAAAHRLGGRLIGKRS